MAAHGSWKYHRNPLPAIYQDTGQDYLQSHSRMIGIALFIVNKKIGSAFWRPGMHKTFNRVKCVSTYKIFMLWNRLSEWINFVRRGTVLGSHEPIFFMLCLQRKGPFEWIFHTSNFKCQILNPIVNSIPTLP